jgi:hypothetical protein
MALYDPDPLLASIASFITLVGNFFAVLFGTYDTDAFWTERYLSGNTEDYYWHIFCWSLDEYDRARAFCWIIAVVVVVVLYFTVGSCRGGGRHAVKRRARESQFEERGKAYEADIKGLKEQVATRDGATEALENRIGDLQKDLTGAEEKVSDLKKDLTGAKEKILDLEKKLDESEKAKETALDDFDHQKDLVETQRRDLKNQKTELENQRKQLEYQEEQLKGKERKLEAQRKATRTQEDLVDRIRGEKVEADKAAKARCNRLDQALLSVRKELRAEEGKIKGVRAAKEKAERMAEQAKATANTAGEDAKRSNERFENEQKRSQDLEKDLKRERQNATGAAEAAKKQYESEYADQATRYEDKIRDQQITAENQATERQKEHDTELKTLQALIDAADKQKRNDGDELEKAINEKAKLKRDSDKADKDAAEQIEQLQKQNKEHTDMQHKAQRTRSENESLLEELRTAKAAAKQLKELQEEHSARGETMNALESQVQALKNKIESIENDPNQHYNNAAKGAADTTSAWTQTELPNNAAKGAADTNMAWSQTSLSKYSTAVTDKYGDDKSQYETADRRTEQLETLYELEENFRTAEDVFDNASHTTQQEIIVNLARYTQEYEGAARQETMTNPTNHGQGYESTARQETTANMANVVCRWHLGDGCRDRKRCRWQHPDICDKPYCQEGGRSCTMLHRRKAKVCIYWSASGKCASHDAGNCRFAHPVVCFSSVRGQRCNNWRCGFLHLSLP